MTAPATASAATALVKRTLKAAGLLPSKVRSHRVFNGGDSWFVVIDTEDDLITAEALALAQLGRVMSCEAGRVMLSIPAA